MGRRRFPALLALLAGLLLGVWAGAPGVAASTAGSPYAPHAAVADAHGTGRIGSTDTPAFIASTHRPTSGAIVRAAHAGHSGASIRQAVILPTIAVPAAALLAYLIRQRRRSRPAAWHRSTLLARGPPLLLAR